jgi:hypothetical protein
MADMSPPVVAAEEAVGSPPPTEAIEEKAYAFVKELVQVKTRKATCGTETLQRTILTF